MRLIIIRHGQTVDNITGTCQGQADGQLSEKGIAQAKKLGKRFKDQQIDVIYSSDLQRAIDTANEIVKFHPDLQLNLDPRIRERFFGEFQGTKLPKDWDWDNLPEFVETNEEMYQRAKEFLDDILAKHTDEIVVVVCHHGIKRALLSVIHQQPTFEQQAFKGIKNTSVSEFDIEADGRYNVHVINCVKHLEV